MRLFYIYFGINFTYLQKFLKWIEILMLKNIRFYVDVIYLKIYFSEMQCLCWYLTDNEIGGGRDTFIRPSFAKM